MKRTWSMACGLALLLIGCDAGPSADTVRAQATTATASICQVAQRSQPLPEEVRETSGLVQSRRDPGMFWTHNDKGNEPDLFAFDAGGRLVERVRVTGASLVDWEDIDAGPCDGGTCLHIGDIGDNDGARSTITIYSIPEPAAGAEQSAPATARHLRFADGPQDAEALFSLPSGALFLVTKGRGTPIALYRVPEVAGAGDAGSAQPVTLERVRELLPEPGDASERVTAAAATPDGRWVGIRTARTLYLYPATSLTSGGAAEPVRVDLTPLGEIQGESLVLSNDGSVWLTSEAEDEGAMPSWSRLQCTLPDA